MDSGGLRPIDLERAMRARDPRARLVAARLLRRIGRSERRAHALGLGLSHRRSLTLGVAAALRAVSAEELRLDDSTDTAGLLLLIEEPDDAFDPGSALQWAWRRLFHARVHAEIMEHIAAGRLDGEAVAHRIAEIGEGAFDEARSVLDRDGWLASPRDDVEVYGEFAAVFLELSHFADRLLPLYFPRVEDYEAVARTLAQDVDGAALFRATRPDGAPDPAPHPTIEEAPPVEPGAASEQTPARSEARFRWLVARADRARKLGNAVRSAILRNRAARIVGPSRAGQARSAAQDDLAALAARLRAACGDDAVEEARLRSALAGLLRQTARVEWTVEGRLLFDLQTICLDHEREVYELDLAGWIFTFGRRPLKRALPNQKPIRMAKGLIRAEGRLARARIDEADRLALATFLRSARETAERTSRERFRPLIARALERAQLCPRNLPERVSFDRIVEELLDRVVERNHLTMGDVRDAVARSDLRQPDLRSPRELWVGDRVLRADRRLAVSLEGAYRKGEIYLRALQRLSFVGFGTRVGRFLTRYLILPYGGAYGALVTIHELLGFARIHVEITTPVNVAILGTWILLALHIRRFRGWSFAAGRWAWRGFHFAVIGAPSWLVGTPLVRSMLDSAWFDRVRRLLLEPAIVAALTGGVVLWIDRDQQVASAFALGAFALTSLCLGTNAGRWAEEAASDAAARGWRRVRMDLLPGVIRLILEVFDALLEGVERLLYAVDEALRFRSGEGRITLWGKAALGMLWGAATYLIRIFVNLMVEPTVNPVKHFPTVTVAAKMILPKIAEWTEGLAHLFGFLGGFLAWGLAATIFVFLPGLAGFFVWELKENWRLFEANRPKSLRPEMVGHHGETIRRLLVPGFHSGTVPKLFAKLRHAAKRSYVSGDARSERKAIASMHHVEEPVSQFLERGFVAMLVEGGAFDAHELHLADVEMATNRIRIEFTPADGHTGEGFRIAFDAAGGRLVMRVEDDPWRSRLDEERRRAYDVAILGLAARSGAQEIEAASAANAPSGVAELPPFTTVLAMPPVWWDGWVAFWGEGLHPEVGPKVC